jgi:hypothetical protein
MQYTSFKTKQKALDTPTIDVDTWWNLVQIMLFINPKEIFVRHYVNEEAYRRKLKVHMEGYLEFMY